MSFFDKRERGRIKKPLYMALYSGPGVGKCFQYGTKVLMHDGSTKEIQNIRLDDLVMGPDSKPRKVLGTSQGIDNLYEVTLRKGDSFVCNSRHDIVGETKRFKPFKREAKDLASLSDSQIERFKILRTGVDFKSTKTGLDPYFVGIWLGDGNKDLTSLIVNNPDRAIKSYLKRYARKMGCQFKNRDGLTLHLTSYTLGESWKKHPFKDKLKCCIIDGEKRIPKEYLINSRHNRLRLLAGIIDTDGYLINKTFEVVTQYQGLSDDIIYLSKSLGFQATHKEKIVDGKIYHRIFISGYTSKIPTRIKRKQAAPRKQIKNVLREGFKIEKLGKADYYGISVDGDHLFLLANFVIVHNTSAAATFPSPHFFDFEESTHALDVSRSRPLSWDEIEMDLMDIRDSQDAGGIKTIIFDTIDELERLIHRAVAEKKGKDDIGDIGWQKGFDAAVNYWAKLVSLTREIRDKHKIHIVFLAHSFAKSKTDLEKESYYARYQMALHPKAADYIFGQVEMVLFAKKDIAFKTVDDKVFAKDLDSRILCTSLSAYYDAKNRIGLPSTLPMPYKNMFQVLWQAYEKAFNDTPETLYKECIKEAESVKDDDLRGQMISFIEQNKDDITKLRASLARIKERKS